MPGGQTKFSTTWLSTLDSNDQKLSEWCKKGKDDYHAYCIFCAIDIKCDNAGKSQLLQHSTKKKHQEAVKHLVDTGGSHLSWIFWEYENQSSLLVIWLIYIKLYRKKEAEFWKKNLG